MPEANVIDDEADVAETPARGFFPELRVRLYNASRKPLHDETRVMVQWGEHDLSEVVVPPTSYEAAFRFRPEAIGRVVKVRAFPVKHRAVGKFVCLRERNEVVALHCPVKPEAVKAVNFEPFHFGDFEARDIERKVGLRNVWAKMEATKLTEHVARVVDVRRDRIWFEPDQKLADLVAKATDGVHFEPANATLHSPLEKGFVVCESVKTPDRYGGLQLIFWGRPGERASMVEADIDDASGIGHLFQVLRNALPGVSTNPYDIGEILRFHQELDPGYELVV